MFEGMARDYIRKLTPAQIAEQGPSWLSELTPEQFDAMSLVVVDEFNRRMAQPEFAEKVLESVYVAAKIVEDGGII